MISPPLILVTPCVERKGVEMGDVASSLSECYQRAVMAAGGLPLTMPCTVSRELIAECVRRADGVMLTGGDDIHPDLYSPSLPAHLRNRAIPECRARDLRELLLIEEVFLKRKPLLAICRGHQMLNIAFGGTLFVDLPTQRATGVNHRRLDAKRQVVHDLELEVGSLLACVVGQPRLGVNSTHHQAVDRIGSPLVAAGRAPDGLVEVLELKPAASHLLPFLISVQFHPERLVERHPEHLAIFQAFVVGCARLAPTGVVMLERRPTENNPGRGGNMG